MRISLYNAALYFPLINTQNTKTGRLNVHSEYFHGRLIVWRLISRGLNVQKTKCPKTNCLDTKFVYYSVELVLTNDHKLANNICVYFHHCTECIVQ